MQASAQWIFAFGNRSLKALQVIIITCFAVTLIICFYASALFWFKVFSPPAPPLRTVGYCFIGTSCRFSTFIPSSLLMVYLIQSLHSCFIFITNSFPCSRTLGKKEKKKKKPMRLSWYFLPSLCTLSLSSLCLAVYSEHPCRN